MLNCNQGMLTSASLKDIWRGPSLGTCAFLDSTITQCDMAHSFLDYYYMEAEDNVPPILKERTAVRK